MPSSRPRLVLVELAEGARVVAPEGLGVGGELPLPSTASGMWIALGSGPRQEITLRDQPAGVVRSHVRFTRRGGQCLIQSRGHATGYVLNGTHYTDCTARPIREGDTLRLGPHLTFRFAVGEATG